MEVDELQLEHYSQIVKDHLKENHKNFYQSLIKHKELEIVANNRAKRYLQQLQMSNNPQQDNEIYFQMMLEF